MMTAFSRRLCLKQHEDLDHTSELRCYIMKKFSWCYSWKFSRNSLVFSLSSKMKSVKSIKTLEVFIFSLNSSDASRKYPWSELKMKTESSSNGLHQITCKTYKNGGWLLLWSWWRFLGVFSTMHHAETNGKMRGRKFWKFATNAKQRKLPWRQDNLWRYFHCIQYMQSSKKLPTRV